MIVNALFQKAPKRWETVTGKENHRKAPKRKKNGKERGEIAERDLRCNHDRSASPSAQSGKTEDSLPNCKNGLASLGGAAAAPHSGSSSKILPNTQNQPKWETGAKPALANALFCGMIFYHSMYCRLCGPLPPAAGAPRLHSCRPLRGPALGRGGPPAALVPAVPSERKSSPCVIPSPPSPPPSEAE